MKPVEFAGQQTLLDPPKGTPRGQCGVLPVMVSDSKTWPGSQEFTSFWKPSRAELEVLNDGGHVGLRVVAAAQPPVAVFVQKVEELP